MPRSVFAARTVVLPLSSSFEFNAIGTRATARGRVP